MMMLQAAALILINTLLHADIPGTTFESRDSLRNELMRDGMRDAYEVYCRGTVVHTVGYGSSHSCCCSCSRPPTARTCAVSSRSSSSTATRTSTCVARAPGSTPALALGDRGDDVALAHAAGAGDAQLLGELLEFGQEHGRQALAPGGCARRARHFSFCHERFL